MKYNQTKIAKIAAAMAADPSVRKYLKTEYAPSAEALAERLLDFVQATRDGRMFCVIHSVSSSGMSRNMAFYETTRYNTPLSDGRKFCQCTFYSLMKALGYRAVGDAFRVNGCGMNMVFATHYRIIHSALRFGAITKKECAKLSQVTPTYF